MSQAMTLSANDAPTIRHPAKAEAPARIAALDWVKGALVVFMVVYHAINYSAFNAMAFRYLAFLPPSFILIAGFLVAQVYAARYDTRSAKPYLRLVARGLKLLLLFTVLNLAYRIAILGGGGAGISDFAARSGNIYISGNARTGIFEVLLPIAYFLLLAPILLWLRFRGRGIVALFCGVSVLACLFLELRGQPLENLSLLSAGLIGMGLGLLPLQWVDRLAGRWVVVVVLYLAYRVGSLVLGEGYPIQMTAAVVTLLLLYAIALRLPPGSWFSRGLVLLGQYSLWGYLVQIAVLQILVKILFRRPEQLAEVGVLMVATAVITFLATVAVHEIRRRSNAAAAIYKLLFA